MPRVSYSFAADRSYRMPSHFGPNPGPRQRPDGGLRGLDQSVRSILIWASFEADREQVAALLPFGFEPSRDADLTVEIKKMTDIGWLAGRGYSVITVTTGVTYTGGSEPEDGRFKLVLWENAADPIITGREEIGYPKVFADIPDISIDGETARGSASWDGFGFLDLEVSGLDAPAEPAPTGRSWHLKYIPRAGTVGQHDLVQTILTPPGQGPLEVLERRGGSGTVAFHSATWEQLPTLVNIVNSLAALRLGSCRAAGLTRTAGGTDLIHQVIVAEDRMSLTAT